MPSKHRFATEEIENFSTVDLITELKRRYQVLSRPERSCVLLGAPYSGVSTQSNFLRKEWGLCSIKRRDLYSTPEATLDSAISRLSDDIGSFRCRRGFILENFPSSPAEGIALDDLIRNKHPSRKDYRAILLDLPHSNEQEKEHSEQELMRRAQGLLLHPSSGRQYNANVEDLRPQTPNVDDVSGEPLVCPNSDLSSVSASIRNWWDSESAISSFSSRLARVDARKSIDSVSIEVSRILLGDSPSIAKDQSSEI